MDTTQIYLVRQQGKPVYVGRSYDAAQRSRRHRARFGKACRIEILETVTTSDAMEAEKRWIAHFGIGILRNKRVSGSGAFKGVPRNWSAKGIGKLRRTQFKRGSASWAKGKRKGKEWRAKISASVSKTLIGNQRRLGIPHSEETKKCLSKIFKRHPNATRVEWSKRSKSFWSSMSESERKGFIARRELARQKSLKAK